MQNLSGAHVLLKTLIRLHVNTIFGYPGGAIMPIYDALYHFKDKIRHILTRHEQGAVHAAEGYARATGNVGVCFATSGPGATNLLTGIADAILDSVPLVCVTGQVPSSLLGTDAFQEANIIGMTTPVTKWNYQITQASEIVPALEKAFNIAKQGRPGPVHLDITKNAQLELLKGSSDVWKLFERKTNLFKQKELDAACALIQNSHKPLLLVGHGVCIANAEQELFTFAVDNQIPVACTLHGLSSFPSDHSLFVGMLGMHGNYAPNVLTNEADVIIAVGMRFDDRVTGNLQKYAKQAKIIHIDIDPAEHNKNVLTTVSLVGDAKEILNKINYQCKREIQCQGWLKNFSNLYEIEYENIIKHELSKESNSGIKMAEVIFKLCKKTKGNALIVADVGQHQMVAARYYMFKKHNSFISSGGLGTMGFALPAAIGAKIGAQSREVIAVVGDGGFQMNIQELSVLCQENIALKIILLNNSFLGMVRQWQELFFESRYSFTEMLNPNFPKIVEAYGIKARSTDNHLELDCYLDEMITAKESFFLEVKVKKEENVFPMIPAGAGVNEVRFS